MSNETSRKRLVMLYPQPLANGIETGDIPLGAQCPNEGNSTAKSAGQPAAHKNRQYTAHAKEQRLYSAWSQDSKWRQSQDTN